eukprot:795154-Pleurochrysis_carterae.AAC.2
MAPAKGVGGGAADGEANVDANSAPGAVEGLSPAAAAAISNGEMSEARASEMRQTSYELWVCLERKRIVDHAWESGESARLPLLRLGPRLHIIHAPPFQPLPLLSSAIFEVYKPASTSPLPISSGRRTRVNCSLCDARELSGVGSGQRARLRDSRERMGCVRRSAPEEGVA